MSDPVLYAHEGPIATITLNRDETRNALSDEVIAGLLDALAKAEGDTGISCVILTGAGKSFCAGGDLAWMKEQFSATRESRIAEARKLAHMLGALNELPKPLIGRCLLYTSPSPRDLSTSRMPSSA